MFHKVNMSSTGKALQRLPKNRMLEPAVKSWIEADGLSYLKAWVEADAQVKRFGRMYLSRMLAR